MDIAPSAAAASAISGLFASELDVDGLRVALPRPEAQLVVRIGRDAHDGLDVHVMGVRETAHRKYIRGGQRTVAARLRLGAQQAVLGVPAAALVGRIVALDELWGSGPARRLRERLRAAPDLAAAAAVLDAAIAERLVSTQRRDVRTKLALAAAERLAHAHVNAVADDLGVSERHLRRVFQETLGMGPKAYVKLTRFDRALRAAREPNRESWASIAANAGYYDQAHLIAEFRAITGVTPRALLGELAAV